eukprot:5876794-Prymnesium_polylepis.1
MQRCRQTLATGVGGWDQILLCCAPHCSARGCSVYNAQALRSSAVFDRLRGGAVTVFDEIARPIPNRVIVHRRAAPRSVTCRLVHPPSLGHTRSIMARPVVPAQFEHVLSPDGTSILPGADLMSETSRDRERFSSQELRDAPRRVPACARRRPISRYLRTPNRRRERSPNAGGTSERTGQRERSAIDRIWRPESRVRAERSRLRSRNGTERGCWMCL